jgi:DNA polymerase-3 subunit epsilon
MEKRIWIDTETTSRDAETTGLLQLSGFTKIGGEIKDKFNFFIKPFPNQFIDDEALAVNNIKRDDIKNFLEPIDAYKKFIRILTRHVDPYEKKERKEKFHFFGYNSNFDMTVLRKFFENNNDKYFGSFFYFPYIDVMTLAALELENERKNIENFKLNTVFSYVGLTLPEGLTWHDAEADTLAAEMLFNYFIEKRNK